MNGQVSVELLMVIGLGIGIIGLYTIYGYASINSYKQGNDEFLMKDALAKIAETSKFVAFQGEPAKQQVNVCFPVSYSSCSIMGKTITCYLRSNREIYQDLEVNMSGSLPSVSGCWNLILQANGSEVAVSYVT